MPIQPELSHLKKSILKNKAYTAEKTAELAQAVSDALVECMSHAFSCSISQTGWQTDNTAGYPYYLDIPIENITENDRADVMILPDSMETAKNCNFCPVSQTLNGKVRVCAASIPVAAIMAEIWITKGGGIKMGFGSVNLPGISSPDFKAHTDAMQTALNGKAASGDLISHTGDTTKHITASECVRIKGTSKKAYHIGPALLCDYDFEFSADL